MKYIAKENNEIFHFEADNLDEGMSMIKKIGASVIQLLHEAGHPKVRKFRREQGIPLYGNKKD